MNEAFPKHDYFYHGLFTDCSVCLHPGKCARLQRDHSLEKADVCRVCIAEDNAPKGLTIEQWCTECEHTIPNKLRSEVYVHDQNRSKN